MSTETRKEGLAPAAGGAEEDGARELHPFQMWDKGISTDEEAEMYDFRGKPDEVIVDEDEPDETEAVDPKASSAAGSALAAAYEAVKTPLRRFQESETPATVEEEATPPADPASGSSTGSETPPQKSGKTEPPAAT